MNYLISTKNVVWTYLFGPQLHTIKGFGALYSANPLESIGNFLVGFSGALNTFCVASSPMLLPYLLMRYDMATLVGLAKCAIVLYSTAILLRATGRLTNGTYRQFANVALKVIVAGDNASRELKDSLKQYDYQIPLLPVADFIARRRDSKWFPSTQDEDGRHSVPEPLSTLREALAYWAVHSFGRRMLFPGSLSLLKALVGGTLIESRRKNLADKLAERNVLKTEDGNFIDSMFWDRRKKTSNGNTLVICFEGNAGFYEAGIAVTPNALNYSVLGWNMPGFGESSGAPYPETILNAADAAMQFATERLGFAPSEIVLYAWSIGGFPASWAAANYPDVRALILDASFDDLVPLAVGRMPSFMRSLVHYTVRKYLNLPIAKQVRNYPGLVRFIRRWNDEIIINDEAALDDHGRRATNRANYLLIDFLRYRYPGLFRSERDEELVKTWLALDAQSRVMMFNCEEPTPAHVKILTALKAIENTDTKPSGGGGLESLDAVQLSVLIQQLCNKHFIDYDASHNVPLDSFFFNIPTPLGNALPSNSGASKRGIFSGPGNVLGRAPSAAKDNEESKLLEKRNSRDSIQTLSSLSSSSDDDPKNGDATESTNEKKHN